MSNIDNEKNLLFLDRLADAVNNPSEYLKIVSECIENKCDIEFVIKCLIAITSKIAISVYFNKDKLTNKCAWMYENYARWEKYQEKNRKSEILL